MNYIQQLTGFFHKVAVDNRLNPTHVSLYMAIFQYWNAGRFQNPVCISRQELMRISKISAKATYHKCIKDLHTYGYIQYTPSYNPFKGSLVYLFDFQTSISTSTSLFFDPSRTKIETSIEQALVPYINNNINNINKTNIERENTQPKNDIVLKVSKNKVKVVEVNGETIPPKKNASKRKLEALISAPDIVCVHRYFLEQKSSKIEAEKFYNYYQSNGWKIGGKSPMHDWQAAARNWLLNDLSAQKQPPKPITAAINSSQQPTTITKNYAEPL